MSKVVLYGTDTSPPVRACLLALNALEIPFEYKIVNMMKNEHLAEEFVKHNPQHTVPVLDDNGTWLWDSHAICSYLVDKYGKEDSLYPKDLAKRAVVNQRMYFDASILYMTLRNITLSLFKLNQTVITKEQTASVLEGYNHVENFLGDNPYIVGQQITIADFCCVATMSSLKLIIDIDEAKFPNIVAWLERLSKLPYYEKINGKSTKEAVAMLKSKITEIIF